MLTEHPARCLKSSDRPSGLQEAGGICPVCQSRNSARTATTRTTGKSTALTRPSRPTKFGRPGARVGIALCRRRTENFAGDVGENSAAQTGLKRFFHAAIFAGMECQNRHASAGIQARGQVAEKRVERGEFVVHGNAQRLKDAADGEVAIFLVSDAAARRGWRWRGIWWW